MISIKSAFAAYLDGILDGHDLQEVVEAHGFYGWTCTKNEELVVYYGVNHACKVVA